MDCPSCQGSTNVVETRTAEQGVAVRRRRECSACGRRFTTFERPAPARLWVRKRSEQRQPFDRAKLVGALARAAHKRPVSAADVDGLVDRIEAKVEEAGGELTSEAIRELCLNALGDLDAGAYLQFAGVELSDLDAIQTELERHRGRSQNNPANREQTKAGFRPTGGAGSIPPNRRQTRGEI